MNDPRRASRIVVPLMLGCLVSFACGDSELPPAALWPGQDVRPGLEHPFFDQHPRLRDLSLYATYVEGDPEARPDHQHRGAFGVGNGKAFALMGLVDPLSTLHSMVGPVYDKGARFFGDSKVVLEEDGQVVPFTHEWIARVRGTAVMITRADTGRYSQYTVDFAPRPAGVDDLMVPPVIVRIILVTSTSNEARDVALRFDRDQTTRVIEGLTVEPVPEDPRYLGYLAWGRDFRPGPKAVHIDLGRVEPGHSKTAVLVLATGTSTAAIRKIEADLKEANAEAWLEQTVDWWLAHRDKGVKLSLADERIEDLLDGMIVSLRAQQSVSGAICPMSEYTLMWLRDTGGAIRFLTRAGYIEEARTALTYLYACHIDRGDISNACESDLLQLDLSSPPDWETLGTFSGRQAAEGPTHVPLMYRDYVDQTGDWAPVVERWPYLQRALLAQVIDERGRQPFSGDETFRTAMSAALGYDLAELYERISWSANSAFLMAAAAEWMAMAAEKIGKPDDAAVFSDLASLARRAMEQEFLLPEGHYAPFILRDGEVPETRPYEDVSLMALYSGAIEPDAPVALSNLRALQRSAGRGDGTVQSPMHSRYDDFLGLDIRDGIGTGMVPGYYLYNLARIGDPEAALAFNALHAYADNAGQYGEYMVYDDLSALSPIYDSAGALGDYTAHYRPWEGGINLDAFLYYLFGLTVSSDRTRVAMRPHLPNSLPSLDATRLNFGPLNGTLHMSQTGTSFEVVFTSESDESFTLDMEIPIPHDVESSATPAGSPVTLPGGEQVMRFDPVNIQPGANIRFFLDYS